MEARFANADHRRVGHAAHGVEAGIIEAGDDDGVRLRMLGNGLQQSGKAHRFVIVAFDADRPALGIDRDDLG